MAASTPGPTPKKSGGVVITAIVKTSEKMGHQALNTRLGETGAAGTTTRLVPATGPPAGMTIDAYTVEVGLTGAIIVEKRQGPAKPAVEVTIKVVVNSEWTGLRSAQRN